MLIVTCVVTIHIDPFEAGALRCLSARPTSHGNSHSEGLLVYVRRFRRGIGMHKLCDLWSMPTMTSLCLSLGHLGFRNY